jgi:hypothetical protein
MKVVELEIDLRKETGARDLEVWEYFKRLLLHLTPDGMSSDETTVVDHRVAYYVKIIPWRREEVTEIMAISENARVDDKDLWDSRGGKPFPRIRKFGGNGLKSTRHIVKTLPRSLCSERWLSKSGNAARVKVSKETFKWVDIVLRRDTED